MLRTINSFIRTRKKQESAFGELVSLLFIIPLLVWFLFTMVDVAMYFEARRAVQQVNSEAASTVAILGGNNSIYNTAGKSVAAQTKDILWDGTRCNLSQCPKGYVPKVTCTPNRATKAMQEVSCTTKYKYKSLFGSGVPNILKMTSREFTIVSSARSQTGF